MVRRHQNKDEDVDLDGSMEDSDDEPIPARRDTRIFQRDKDDKDEDKKEDFEEDVFV